MREYLDASRRHLRPHPAHRQRLSRRHRRWFYGCGGALGVSGVGWLISHFFLRGAGMLAELPHPAEPWWLRLHGAAAMGFLIAFGAVLPAHVVHGWRRRINLVSGVALLVTAGLLVGTAYGLYYFVGDTARALTSVIHWVVGLWSVAAVIWHVRRGRVLVERGDHRAV